MLATKESALVEPKPTSGSLLLGPQMSQLGHLRRFGMAVACPLTG